MPMRLTIWIASLMVVAVLALIIAYYVRYELVEPTSMGAFCEATTTHWRCQIRQAIIALLTDHRLGFLAIALAALGLLFGLSALGWCAWFLAATGFVLYNAELAAPSLLLAGVALARARRRVQNHGHREERPAACEH
jgi:hypothetical protein